MLLTAMDPRPAPIAPEATPAGRFRSKLLAMDLASRVAAALAVLAVACTASESEVRPPVDTLLFPTAIAVSPDDSVAFVVGGNSDLGFDSGTVQVLDLAVVSQVVTAWQGTDRVVAPGCTASIEAPETLECAEADFLREDAAVRIGNFASAIALQDLGAGKLRVLVPVRGDPSLTWMDWDPATGSPRLACSDGQGFDLCDDDHRLKRLRNDSELPAMPAEPYGIYVDSTAGYAMISHFVDGAMSLVDSPRDGVPALVDAVATGSTAGLSGIAGRKSGDDNLIYVQSRESDRVFLMTVAKPTGDLPFLVPAGFFFLNGVGGGSNLGGTAQDSRGIVFTEGGDRAYLVNRSPPALMVLDTSLGADGVPQNRLIGSTDICRRATTIAVVDTGAGERAYVTCYATGELYTIDPRSGGVVEANTLVGRGPIASAAAPSRRLLLVASFLDNAISVVDIDPASPAAYHVVLRIGGQS